MSVQCLQNKTNKQHAYQVCMKKRNQVHVAVYNSKTDVKFSM